MRRARAEIPVPVSNRISGVQYRGDLVVLAQIPQPVIVFETARRRQQRRTYHRHRFVACRLDRVDAAGRRKHLDGLATGRRKVPQRRGRLVVVIGRTYRDEQQVTLGCERGRRLALRPSGQAAARRQALRVQFPDRGDVFGALLAELADGGHDARAVWRDGQPGHSRKGEEVVEIAEWGFGHAMFVAQPGSV